MPTYDYECTACQHRFEQFQKITDDVLKICPACKKPKLNRLFGTGAAIVFKGSGFYQTDYRSESYKKKAESESKSGESSAGGSGESKTPAKPESKPSEKPKNTKNKRDE